MNADLSENIEIVHQRLEEELLRRACSLTASGVELFAEAVTALRHEDPRVSAEALERCKQELRKAEKARAVWAAFLKRSQMSYGDAPGVSAKHAA